jgi:2-methylcitrate dehydratase PrpD
VRLGVAIDGPTVLYRGIWPTYFAAPFGVAAVAARLLRLDQLQTAHALANAFIMLTPGTGHHAAVTTARWLAVGQAAARGWQAALAAQAGFTSDLKLADGDFLKNVYGIAPNVAVLRDGLGEIALHQTSYKPWCAARQTMAATQALKEIMTDGVAADAITVVEAAVLPAHLKMIDHGVTPGDRFSHLTSVQYQMAVAALAPDTAYDVARPADAIAPALQSFMSRINVRADDGLIADGYPQAWAAHVAVTTASRRLERRVSRVPGDPGMPPTRDDLKVKFVRVTASILKGDEAGRIFELGLEALARPRDALLSIERLEPR